MESTWEKRRTVIAAGLAVLMALALATSMTYAFPAPQAGSTTITESSDCLSQVPHVLNMPRNITLSENDTTTINGTTYWYVSFVPRWTSEQATTDVLFHGVNFSVSAGSVQGETIQNASQFTLVIDGKPIKLALELNVYDETLLTAETSANTLCTYALPSVTVEWGGPTLNNVGEWEYFNQVGTYLNTVPLNKTASLMQENVYYSPPSSNPWFTQHIGPQAGVGYQTSSGEITLYVSAS